MAKRISSWILLATIILLTACTGQGNKINPQGKRHEKQKGDQFVYGLACDGCSDTTVVFLPYDGSDPISYSIINASRNNQVFGHPEIGDWIALLVNPKNRHEALTVIDLDQLKGTWTYQVLPKLKENALKSEGEIKAELTDSMKAILFVPREYGFTLRRQYQASSVGAVYRGNSLDQDSPVEYPPVRRYTGWAFYNGKLILRGDTVDKKRVAIPENKIKKDTMEVVFLRDDSLALRQHGVITGYHRQKNAMEANKKASEAAKKQAEKDTIKR